MAPSLEEATACIQSGNLQHAQEVLAKLLRADIQNEPAWFLLAQCVSDPKQREQCLQRVVALNPQHTLAQRLLSELLPQLSPPTSASFQPRAFALAESVNEQRAVSTESFEPRDFILADRLGIEETPQPPTPAVRPRPFAVAEEPDAISKDSSHSLPAWVRQPNASS